MLNNVFQGSFKEHCRSFQGTLRKFKWYFKEVQRVSLGNLKGVRRMNSVLRDFKDVFRKLHGYFKKVHKVFQGSFNGLKQREL